MHPETMIKHSKTRIIPMVISPLFMTDCYHLRTITLLLKEISPDPIDPGADPASHRGQAAAGCHSIFAYQEGPDSSLIVSTRDIEILGVILNFLSNSHSSVSTL